MAKYKFILLILSLIIILISAGYYLVHKGLIKFAIVLSVLFLVLIGIVMRDNIDKITY